MGEVVDVSYFSEADSCGMIEDEDCDKHDFSWQQMEKENCCSDIQELIPGNQNEQQAIECFELDQVQFVFAYTYTYLNLFEVKEEKSLFISPSPPLIDKDYQILYQSFLI